MKPNPEFTRALNALIPAKVSVADAARLIKVSRRTIYLWLAGEGNPNLATQIGTLAILNQHLAQN